MHPSNGEFVEFVLAPVQRASNPRSLCKWPTGYSVEPRGTAPESIGISCHSRRPRQNREHDSCKGSLLPKDHGNRPSVALYPAISPLHLEIRLQRVLV